MTRRVAVVLATIGTLLCIGAGISSAASLEVASACSTVTKAPQVNSIYEPLSTAQISKTQLFCKLAKINVHTLHFWKQPKNHWRLYSRQKLKKCWQITDLKESVSACMLARKDVRQHTTGLVWANTKAQHHAKRRYAHWLLADFSCIQSGLKGTTRVGWGEGSWHSVDGIYHGGLQMDGNFQETYGPEFLARYGTADKWPAWAQLTAAIRAWKVRGFAPWPLTARACGLPTSPPTSYL